MADMTHTLTATDTALARHLAATLAKAGEYGPTLDDFDRAQADGTGFTFDLGRAAATINANQHTSWQRHNGYVAEDWPAVRVRVGELVDDPSFRDSLGA